MSEWHEYLVGDLIESVSNTHKNIKDKMILINTSDVYDGKFLTSTFNDTKDMAGQFKKSIQEDDILFSEIRPANKRFAYVNFEQTDDYICSTKLMVLRRKANDINMRFFYHWITDSSMLEYLQFIAENRSGTFPQITFDTLRTMKINLPKDIEEQKTIAEILSSLDDKIDLLNKQNKTLESLAQTEFNYFYNEIVNESEEKNLSYYGKIICGKTPSKSESENFGGKIPFIKIPDMHNNMFILKTEDSLTEKGMMSQKNKTLPKDSIIVSCIATVGLVSITTKESQTNQQINAIIPHKKIYRNYLYLFLKSIYEELQLLGSGGTMTLNINTTDFSKIICLFPGEKKIENFDYKINILFDKIKINTSHIENLVKIRDTLLPKLINGEIRVKVEE